MKVTEERSAGVRGGALSAVAVKGTSTTGRTAACVPIKKKGKEIPVARETLAGIPGGFGGATVTGDAAHCQKQTARQIVDAEGEYLLQAKANQRALLAKARSLEGRAPFLTST